VTRADGQLLCDRVRISVALGGVDNPPALISAGLAAAAAITPEMSALRTLTGWVGDGKEVTGSELLRPGLVPEICALLGIDLPAGAKVRSAADVEPLCALWDTARAAGLVTVGSKIARARRIPEPEADPEGVLGVWLDSVYATFSLTPDDLCDVCLTVLAILAEYTGPVSMATVLEELACDFNPDDDDDELDWENITHAVSTAQDLEFFGAVSLSVVEDVDKSTAELTPLGRMLTDTVFARLTVPADGFVDEMVSRLGQLTPRTGVRITGDWLAARSVPGAAAELLDFASFARADQRTVAVGLATTLGDDAAPAWRERVSDRGVGPYARAWLAERGEPALARPQDEEWMEVERISAAAATLPGDLLPVVFDDIVGSDDPDLALDLLRQLNRSKHPDADRLAVALNKALGRPSVPARRAVVPLRSVAAGAAHQLRVSLRHVDDPPVWRQIAVDAGTTLADLHLLIQAAMGWENRHEHQFLVGGQQLDETLTVGQVLRRPGLRMLYIYDFGDDWCHDILLEEVGQGLSLPVVLAGAGACPPEDCGGAARYSEVKGPLEAVAFSLEASQVLVRQCASLMTSAQIPAKVVRIQPRKKRKRG